MTEDYDRGWQDGSDAQDEADHRHIILPLIKRIKGLEERIELAIDYLPESPDKALNFLKDFKKELV